VSERLLTARVVAERLDVSPETVLRWTRRGLLPAIKLPSGAIRYEPERMERWLEDHTVADTADRGLSETRAHRARRLGAYGPLPFPASETRPQEDAAKTKED
jgi:predicted DNA-binding transcriptional regulator AlpA